MPVEIRRFPIPTAEAGVDPGDLVVMTTNSRSELGLVTLAGDGHKLVVVLATLAGDPDGDGVPRITGLGGTLCKVTGSVIARPVSGKALAVEGDPSAGALTLTPDGAYIRVHQKSQVGYIDLATGKFEDPSSPRAYFEEWSLAFDGQDERIFATIGAKSK